MRREYDERGMLFTRLFYRLWSPRRAAWLGIIRGGISGGVSDVMGRPNSGASLCSFAPGLSDRGNRKGAIGNSLMTGMRGESSSKVSAGRGRRNCKTY